MNLWWVSVEKDAFGHNFTFVKILIHTKLWTDGDSAVLTDGLSDKKVML